MILGVFFTLNRMVVLPTLSDHRSVGFRHFHRHHDRMTASTTQVEVQGVGKQRNSKVPNVS